MADIQTIVIDNFSGNLTPEIYGDLNSGMCPVSINNFGKNPYWSRYRKGGLEFLSNPSNIASTVVVDPILHFVNRQEVSGSNNDSYCYGAGMNGNIYKFRTTATATPNADLNSGTIITAAAGFLNTLKYGGGMLLSQVSGTEALYIGHDAGFSYASNFTSAAAVWHSVSASSSNVPRPMAEFLGKIYFADAYRLSQSSDGATIGNANVFSPSLPNNYFIRDIEISPDGRYLYLIATYSSNGNNAAFDVENGYQALYGPVNSVLVSWNGADAGYTTLQQFYNINLTAIGVSNNSMVLFGRDDEGAAVFDQNGNVIQRIYDFGNAEAVWPPLAGQIFAIGVKYFFFAQIGNTTNLFLFNIQTGEMFNLYQWGISGTGGIIIPGAITVAALNALKTDGSTNISSARLYAAGSSLPVATQADNQVYTIHLQFQGQTGEKNIKGYYTTQVQYLPRKSFVKEIRIFTSPTASGDSFTVNLIKETGVAYSGGSLTYTYAAGTVSTSGQGSLDMIRFTPQMKAVLELGVQIYNVGGTALAFKKIEIDIEPAQKPQNS